MSLSTSRSAQGDTSTKAFITDCIASTFPYFQCSPPHHAEVQVRIWGGPCRDGVGTMCDHVLTMCDHAMTMYDHVGTMWKRMETTLKHLKTMCQHVETI